MACEDDDICGPNRALVDDKCYRSFEYEMLSWNDASDTCVGFGGQLASLHTERDWSSIETFKKSRGNTFIGLRIAPAYLPEM